MRGALALLALASLPGIAAAETVAIERATIHTAPGNKLDGATIVIRDGVVVAVGKGVSIPAGARTIDGRGKIVTAGFIDAYTTLGLVEVDLIAQTNEGRFEVDADDRGVHAAYRVVDGYNPQSAAIPIARAGGITSVIAVPRGGLVAGTSACLALADAVATDKVTVRSPTAMHVALGEAAREAGDGSRGRALERLRELFDDAAQYAKRKADYEKRQVRDLSASRLDLEALLPVVRGQLPIVVHAHRASDILAAVAMARELGAPLVIAGGAEAWQVAQELASAKATVILNPLQNLPATFDELHVRDDAATVLDAAGVTVILSTIELFGFTGASPVRQLRQVAGVAVAHGLPWERALAAVTTLPSDTFGLGTRGAIARGAPADLVLWSGDPFELSTRPEVVFVGGVEQSLRTRQTLLLERYRTLTPR